MDFRPALAREPGLWWQKLRRHNPMLTTRATPEIERQHNCQLKVISKSRLRATFTFATQLHVRPELPGVGSMQAGHWFLCASAKILFLNNQFSAASSTKGTSLPTVLSVQQVALVAEQLEVHVQQGPKQEVRFQRQKIYRRGKRGFKRL